MVKLIVIHLILYFMKAFILILVLVFLQQIITLMYL